MNTPAAVAIAGGTLIVLAIAVVLLTLVLLLRRTDLALARVRTAALPRTTGGVDLTDVLANLDAMVAALRDQRVATPEAVVAPDDETVQPATERPPWWRRVLRRL